MAPWRASIRVQAHRRAMSTAAAILSRAGLPLSAISSSVRQAVGTEATGPNSSCWSVIARKSLITRAPSAIAQDRSVNTRPRSCSSSRGLANAPDRPAVSPDLSASSRSTASPACETTPSPSAVTSKPRDQPVTFTTEVLLAPGPM